METEHVNPGSDHLPSLGAQLTAGRENLGLNLREAAEKLQLLPQQVEALEQDRYDYFKADIFVKGHIRSYAKLINKNPDQLVTLFENKYSRPEPVVQVAKKPQMSQRTIGKPKAQNRMLPVVVGLLALLIVGFALWLALKEDVESTKNESNELLNPIVIDPVDSNYVDQLVDQNKKQDDAQVTIDLPVDNRSVAEQFSQSGSSVSNSRSNTDNASVERKDSANEKLVKQELAEQEMVADNSVQPLLDQKPKNVQLVLNLNDNCWLKVSDSEGKVLAIGMKSSGDRLNLNGKPPYKLILGDATAVKATYQGKPVSITPNPRNNSARFSIGEAGDR